MRKCLGAMLALTIIMVASATGADVNGLIAKLKNPDSDVRRAAAKELGELGTDASPAVPALTKALADKDRYVRRFAAEALGAIGADGAKSAVPQLSLLVNDSSKEVQLAAIEALSKMGAVSTKALANAVKDTAKDAMVRIKAAQGLAQIGAEARGAVPALTNILKAKVKGKGKGKRNDDDIRADVATTLGSIATKEDTAAIEALKAVSEGKQKNKALKQAAGDALRKITGEAPKGKKKNKNN
jgi:HEAT repeat protein